MMQRTKEIFEGVVKIDYSEDCLEVVRHCLSWPGCHRLACNCGCIACATVDTFTEALLFETMNHSVYEPGTMVEAVGIGKNDPRDDPGEFIPGMFIYGRGVEDAEKPSSPEELCYWMYFRAGDLRPLTSAAKRLHAELLRRNRHLPRHQR
jgi:hypothetical protein